MHLSVFVKENKEKQQKRRRKHSRSVRPSTIGLGPMSTNLRDKPPKRIIQPWLDSGVQVQLLLFQASNRPAYEDGGLLAMTGYTKDVANELKSALWCQC